MLGLLFRRSCTWGQGASALRDSVQSALNMSLASLKVNPNGQSRQRKSSPQILDWVNGASVLAKTLLHVGSARKALGDTDLQCSNPPPRRYEPTSISTGTAPPLLQEAI